MARLAALLCILAVSPSSAARGKPVIGDSLEIRTDPSYLGHGTQVVGVMQPRSAKRRTLDHKTGVFTGPSRRRGMVWWVKKREWNPFERTNRAPFKVRMLSENPTGVLASLAEEGKVSLDMKTGPKGKKVLSVSLVKPKPWWQKLI